jgi:hypothetical protein
MSAYTCWNIGPGKSKFTEFTTPDLDKKKHERLRKHSLW